MQIRHAIHFQLSAFNYLIKGIDDTLEVRNLQGSTTNQTAVNIRVGKQFLCIRRLAAATIKDRAVVSNFLTILFSNQGTDESVDFLCLFCSSSLTGTDSPNRLVSQNNLRNLRQTKRIQKPAERLPLHSACLLHVLPIPHRYRKSESDR